MTTKYLTGAYPSGYTVASSVTSLDVESTASIGGTGISFLYTASTIFVENEGTVEATSGNGMIYFPHGASIVNGTTNDAAIIEGSESGIRASDTTVNNFGTIEGSGSGYGNAGIRLGGNSAIVSGSLADTGALIKGFDGVIGTWSTISNFGSIVGTKATGVYFGGENGFNSVSVTNGSQTDHMARISGVYAGVSLRYTLGTVTNFGTITASAQTGVSMFDGGSINNSGTISSTGASGAGIRLAGKVTVVNGSARDATASIAGVAYGITIWNSARPNLSRTIVNYGEIQATGASGYGIVLNAAEHIRNGSSQDASALIEGGKGGVVLDGDRARVVNFATVTGGSAGGVTLKGGNDVLTTARPRTSPP